MASALVEAEALSRPTRAAPAGSLRSPGHDRVPLRRRIAPQRRDDVRVRFQRHADLRVPESDRADPVSRDAPALVLSARGARTSFSCGLDSALCVLGRAVYRIPKLHGSITTYAGPRNPEVGRIGWSDGTVWLDAGKTSAREGHRATTPGTIGFHDVPEDVWDFHIGGYQVCHKWLKARKGRTLSDGDIAHYQKIVVALNETVRIMAEIDEVIEAHSGWPGAFHTASGPAEKRPVLLRVAESSPPYDVGKEKKGATSERGRGRRPLPSRGTDPRSPAFGRGRPL